VNYITSMPGHDRRGQAQPSAANNVEPGATPLSATATEATLNWR